MSTHEIHTTSSAVEDYAKAIYTLQDNARRRRHHQRDRGAPGRHARLGVADGQAPGRAWAWSPTSPTAACELTAAGVRVALEVLRHHRLLELYLAESLGVSVGSRARRGRGPRARALRGARGAHRRQARATRRAIPTATRSRRRDGRIVEEPTEALDSLPVGAPGDLRAHLRLPTRRCCATSPSAASRPGDAFEVVDKQPFDGPLFARFGDDTHVARRRAGAGHARGGRAGA